VHNRNSMWLVALLAICHMPLAAPAARASVKLPEIIADHMVLQRDRKVGIWGWADPGERVTVTMGGRSASCVADGRRNWMVSLGPFRAGGPFELRVAGSNTLTVHDVLVGDVWVCSGQSNMELGLALASNAACEIPRANHKTIRLYTVRPTLATSRRPDTQGSWAVCSPASAAGFSATGYFFGRELQEKLKVPVGLVACAYSGSPIEAWESRYALKRLKAFRPEMARWDWIDRDYKLEAQIYRLKRAVWRVHGQIARAFGMRPPKPPHPLPELSQLGGPSVLFDGMVAPMLPFVVRGVIWEQGEADVGRAALYRILFPALICDWRSWWHEPDMAFYFVQLHNYESGIGKKGTSALAELREAQAAALALPHTGMAVAIDLGDENWVHFSNKQAVGRRLAAAVLAGEYGLKVAARGPEFAALSIDGRTARVSMRNAPGGLRTSDGQAPRAFQIAGADKRFRPADARIERATVVLSSRQVARPVYVRYAWADNPACNLVNQAGLPAVPFRTDR